MLVVDLRGTSIPERYGERSKFVQQPGIDLLFEERDEVLRGVSQFAEAVKSKAQVSQCPRKIWGVEACKGQSGQMVIELLLLHELLDADFKRLPREQVGCVFI